MYYLLFAVLLLILILYLATKKSIDPESFDAFTKSIEQRAAKNTQSEKGPGCGGLPQGGPEFCPGWCSPFQYPDMYNPRGFCSDPFNWGFTYSTGRCPHVFDTPNQYPKQEK